MLKFLSILNGYILDVLIGDPIQIPHPIVYIGKLISKEEKILRKVLPENEKWERIGGCILAVTVPVITYCISFLALLAAFKLNIVLWYLLNTFWAFQIPASKCLADESMKVYRKLKDNDIKGTRKQLSYLVGRETSGLSQEQIIKATVETVAENTSDGVTAPLMYMCIGGVPLAFAYKAVNTLDSMVGYRNEKYENFGKMSAKLDDILNFIPSRICAICMTAASYLCRKDCKNAYRIFIRDRKKHLSPNSAQTESVMAGALGIQLGGTHEYFGKIVEKPLIGDELRKAEVEDIVAANRIMMLTSHINTIIYISAGCIFEILMK